MLCPTAHVFSSTALVPQLGQSFGLFLLGKIELLWFKDHTARIGLFGDVVDGEGFDHAERKGPGCDNYRSTIWVPHCLVWRLNSAIPEDLEGDVCLTPSPDSITAPSGQLSCTLGDV